MRRRSSYSTPSRKPGEQCTSVKAGVKGEDGDGLLVTVRLLEPGFYNRSRCWGLEKIPMSKTRVNVLVETEAPAPSHSLSQPMALTDAVDDAMTMVEAGHDAGRYLPWLYKVHCKLLACPVKKVHHQEIIAKLEPFLLLHTDDEASRKWQRQALSTRQKEGK